MAFARDISDRERLELELLQARKLESIGQLAAGIAHEINTPTQFISDNLHFLAAGFERLLEVLKSYSELVERYCLSGADRATVDEINRRSRLDYLKKQVPKALEQSLDGVNRVTTIVGAMRNFSHHGEEKKVSFDLNASIHNTIVVATNEWKYVANIVFELDAALPFVPGVPGEINQVLLNLVVNAAHAIGDKVDQSRGETGTITLRSGVADGCAFVAISDTGSGIPTTVRDRIFDPFFTTKKLGRGTGQGLAICRNVVQDKHGGRLTFETEEGVGTTFFVRLPLAKDEAPTSPH